MINDSIRCITLFQLGGYEKDADADLDGDDDFDLDFAR